MSSVQLLELKIARITHFFLRAARLLCPIPFSLITFNFRINKPALIRKDCGKQSNINMRASEGAKIDFISHKNVYAVA
jgi:hypothetical protein